MYFRSTNPTKPTIKIYFRQANSIYRDVKIFLHHTNMYANLSKTEKFDKSEITRTTTTIKSFLRPLPQTMLAVKKWVSIQGTIFGTLPDFNHSERISLLYDVIGVSHVFHVNRYVNIFLLHRKMFYSVEIC